MSLFLLFAGFITLAVAALLIWPVRIHPTLSAVRKHQLSAVILLIVAGGGVTLYILLGSPQIIALIFNN